MGHLWFPRFSWQTRAISWMSRELWDKRELSTQCGEACIFVLNEVWSHSIRLVLLHVHYAVDVSNSLDVSVLSNVRFSNMAIEWGGYITCTFFLNLFFIPSSLSYFDVSHFFSWVTLNSHRCLRKRTSVVRRGYFVCPMSPFVFWMSFTLMTFLLVTMLQKGPFHLEQRIYDFVLPGLWHSCRFCCLSFRWSFCVSSFELLCNWR